MAPWVSAIVASIAFILAVFNFYFTFLRRFHPRLAVGSILLIPESPGVILIIPISLFNEGMRSGLVQELRVELHSERFNRRFFPVYFIDFEKYQEAFRKVEENHPAPSVFEYIESPFNPIFLGPKQALSRTIIFLPREILSPQSIHEGRYRAVFAFWKRLNRSGDILLQRFYEMKPEMIKNFQGGKRIVPLDVDLDKIRNQDLPNIGWFKRLVGRV